MKQTRLPFISPALLMGNSLALVGSSGSLTGSGHGSEIDKFDTIIRFNRAPTKSFEEDVGSRTSIRTLNNHVLLNKESPTGYSAQPLSFIPSLREEKILYIGPCPEPWTHRHKVLHPSCKAFCFSFKKGVSTLRAQYKFSKFNPSIGVIAILLTVYAGLQPTIFGFDTSPHASRSHYFEKRPPAGKCHRPSLEGSLLLNLAQQERILIAS